MATRGSFLCREIACAVLPDWYDQPQTMNKAALSLTALCCAVVAQTALATPILTPLSQTRIVGVTTQPRGEPQYSDMKSAPDFGAFVAASSSAALGQIGYGYSAHAFQSSLITPFGVEAYGYTGGLVDGRSGSFAITALSSFEFAFQLQEKANILIKATVMSSEIGHGLDKQFVSLTGPSGTIFDWPHSNGAYALNLSLDPGVYTIRAECSVDGSSGGYAFEWLANRYRVFASVVSPVPDGGASLGVSALLLGLAGWRGRR